ncbi:hypothetical protein FP2506_14229 [Fulvimarina pelagi HTCC2506]|uniref:CsgH-like domain-containing protein n=1 Tax=Fulvimarina pelagi HTCC2506 TaxID=314231 RepID=Q0G484_9HYPH|nr:curli-like amyloid fiber formation chaperone CsgH [Fulvimarina pelagi]EAU41597.1 hypothetical protein FP2506_14229 [Fulvimarina pelagi HTCC2506]
MLSFSQISGCVAAISTLVTASCVAYAHPPSAARVEEPIRCELQITRSGYGVALTAVVHTDVQADGHYDFHVSGNGTDIRQGGFFTVVPGHPETLGSMTLSTGNSVYDAELNITVDSRTTSCSKRIGGGI